MARSIKPLEAMFCFALGLLVALGFNTAGLMNTSAKSPSADFETEAAVSPLAQPTHSPSLTESAVEAVVRHVFDLQPSTKNNVIPTEQINIKELRALARKRDMADQEAVYQTNLLRRHNFYPDLPMGDIVHLLYYYTPHYVCKQERVGRWYDGGKWMCDPRSFGPESVVYSVGSDGEVSFEMDLHSLCNGCQIHTFDMTLMVEGLRNVRKAESEGVLAFHDYGLSAHDNPGSNTKSLKTIMGSLGHTRIDYFKIDCEGCEWSLFNELFKNWTPGLMTQISFELHNYDNIEATHKLLQGFEERGYRIFQYELNYYHPLKMIEISVVHESFSNSPKQL